MKIKKRKKLLEAMIEKFIDLARPGLDRKFVEECAFDFAKPTRKILLIGLIFSVGSIVYGALIMELFIPSLPFFVVILLNIPWFLGFFLGPLIYKTFAPQYKCLFKKHFGKSER